MDYEKLYDRFIKSKKERKDLKGYKEVHHILPRSFGGTDEVDNLVELTAREHFIAHRILARIFPNSGMVHAVYKMACSNLTTKRYRVTSRAYEILRKEHALRVSTDEVAKKKKSLAAKGKKQSREHIKARTESRKNNGPWLSEETKEKIGNSNKGKIGTWAGKTLPKEAVNKRTKTRLENGTYEWSDDRKKKQSDRLKLNPVPKRSFTEEHKEQLRKEKSEKIICPHCGKEGTILIMPRWHFDNCKQRP